MKETLKRICELQPLYSHKNTPEMQERGKLINTVLKNELLGLGNFLASSLGKYGSDFHVSSSDGQGNKVEAPWVRFCSESMSPNARSGYYVVIHFKKNGAGLYLTLGCGASTLKNGSIVTLSETLLHSKTKIARRALRSTFGEIESFPDTIELGGSTQLVRSFENATVLAKYIPIEEIQNTDINVLLAQLALYLETVYEVIQSTGADISAADQSQIEMESSIRPKRSTRGAQGFGLTAAEKRSVELRAMAVTNEWLLKRGYRTKDTSANEPFDILATNADAKIMVEVKGTTSEDPSSILMTANEVKLHNEKKGQTALAIVSAIKLQKGDAPKATGGELDICIGWDIDDWIAVPTAFRLERS